ncbi:PQQ-binding-like beta-propeller repeat protein [Streptomyces sp. Da 82-17]|uniref:outer membrane protein assembly factor BamB family protein n=1 Tax=Streptomyces sp. Da 82-17 TaxID=3377116 RepID=UPI0038D4761A
MRFGPVVRGSLAVFVGLALAGCGAGQSGDGGGGSGGGSGKGPEQAAPKERVPKRYEAPLTFDTAKTVVLPESAGAGKISMAGLQHPLPLVVDRGVVFIARPDGVDVVSGYRHSDPVRITPEHEPLVRVEDLGPIVGGNPAEAPVVAEHGGERLVLSSLVAEVPGSGTTKGHQVVELVAVDPAQATKAWSVEIELGEGHYSVDDEETRVVGVHGGTAVVYASGQLFGVDLGSHRKVWAAKGTYDVAPVLVGDTVVAATADMTDRETVGLSAADGRERWRDTTVSVEGIAAAGPKTVMISGYDTKAEDDGGALLDATTGKRLRSYGEGLTADRCAYDGRKTVVCSSVGGDSAVAYDSATGKDRWVLPDEAETRVAPRVTLVRAGLVYGTTENGPVVLDAETGADKEDAPGIAPYVTDGSVGVALDKDNNNAVTAYPVTG